MSNPCDPWSCRQYNPCRGAAAATCPIWQAWQRELVADNAQAEMKRQSPPGQAVPAYLDDHTVSGLLEDD